jgi:transposase
MPPNQTESTWTLLLPQALLLAQWMSPMRALNPPEADPLRALLRAAIKQSAQSRYIHRLHAVLLVSIGRGCYEVAHWLGDDPRSVERWVRTWELAGDDGLHDHRQGGRRTRLDFAQRGLLADDLAQKPSVLGYPQQDWSGKLIARHIEIRFGIRLSQRQCLRLRSPGASHAGHH